MVLFVLIVSVDGIGRNRSYTFGTHVLTARWMWIAGLAGRGQFSVFFAGYLSFVGSTGDFGTIEALESFICLLKASTLRNFCFARKTLEASLVKMFSLVHIILHAIRN